MFTQSLQLFSAVPNSIETLSNISASIKKILTTRNDRRKRPPLLDLPVEILQTIQDLLPLASAVSLALTHKSLLRILGTGFIHSINLPANASQRTDFLLSLQQDLPAWQFCHPCLLFHPFDKAVNPRTLWLHDEPECAQISGCVFFLSDYYLRYQHAQWVMNRHRSGTLCEDDLNFLAHEYIRPAYGGKDIRAVITASIENGGLAIYLASTLRLTGCWDAASIRHELPQVFQWLWDDDRIVADMGRVTPHIRVVEVTAGEKIKCRHAAEGGTSLELVATVLCVVNEGIPIRLNIPKKDSSLHKNK
ncbi:MAG: hypothetical protein Q9207_003598 [Kuettlingeria erythrocarpa]